MKYPFFSIAIFLSILGSCKVHNAPDHTGTWINSNLDYISFLEDSIKIGYGFAIPPQILPYEMHKDTFVLKPSEGYGDQNDGFKCKFTYEVIDSHQIVLSSDQMQGFFGLRSGRALGIFTNTHYLFVQHNWDSLVQCKYIPIVYDSSDVLMEKMILSNDRKIRLQTQLVDSLKNGTFEAYVPNAHWSHIDQQISYIDSSFFHLLQSAVSDGYILEIKVYHPGGLLTFTGYDFPYVFPELREFLCCSYRLLEYHKSLN